MDAGRSKALFDRHWQRIGRCTRCLDDPVIGPYLSAEPLFIPMPTAGALPDARKPVRYLVVAQEPSGSWARDNEQARKRMAAGLLCFMRSAGDFALQYALERWLIDPAQESYLLTDLAKCALRVKAADATRLRRYRNCAPFLRDEVAMYALRAIIAVGSVAYASLLAQSEDGWPPIFPILHYASRPVTWRRILGKRRGLGAGTLRRLQELVDERTLAGFRPRRVGAGHGDLLAIYREQLAQIRRALGRNARDGTLTGHVFLERHLAQAGARAAGAKLRVVRDKVSHRAAGADA